jgi:hypothetical protein
MGNDLRFKVLGKMVEMQGQVYWRKPPRLRVGTQNFNIKAVRVKVI